MRKVLLRIAYLVDRGSHASYPSLNSSFVASTSKSSGSNSDASFNPSHSIFSSCSGCDGWVKTAQRSAYPHGPPQSSGGHARLPLVHIGKSMPSTAGRIFSRTMECHQSSPKSYQYLHRSPGLCKKSDNCTRFSSLFSSSSHHGSISSAERSVIE